MRMRRLKIHPDRPIGFYHCLSRVVDRRFVLGDSEKAKFVEFMREYEAFCGVDVLSYCILSNHFHILVAVPKRPSELPSEDELLRRLDSVSGATLTASKARQMFDMFRKAKDDKAAEEFRRSIWNRLYDVSEFMKLLKQRYTQWHNRRHQRIGTLWEERFKSVLVEGAGQVLATMAAYIDLNPVRAGLVKDPKDYRWCGYAEALGGSRRAQRGLCKAQGKPVDGWKTAGAAAAYRCLLHAEGREIKDAQNEKVVSRGISAESARTVLAEKGKLSPAELVHLRVRYFTDGLALGSKEFVEGIFTAQRDQFGPKRKQGPRRMTESDAPFYTLRQLRVKPLG